MSESRPDSEAIIAALQLQPHAEGGYFRRTFQTAHQVTLDRYAGKRYCMSSIYYLLTADSPTGHWHLNRADIVHYYHLGSPLYYYMIHPDGSLETATLGADIGAGQQLQLTVRGGTWKASHLHAGDYGLVSEAVAPGFDYADMVLGQRETLLRQFPQHVELITAFTRSPGT